MLILQGIIPTYRLPIFNSLAEVYDLTIGYTISTSEINPGFKSYQVSHIRIKNIFLPTYKFLKSLKKYDVIIIMPDMHYINYCLVPFLPLKQKVISFSIGMRASYKLLYDVKRKKQFLDYFFLRILKSCDANIFYYEYPINFWGGLLDSKKIFIANNTVKVLKLRPEKSKKKIILFLGSLIEGKGIFSLLEAYNHAYITKGIQFPLKIVGEGPLEDRIREFLNKNNLNSKVLISGAIYEEELLKEMFSEAIFCISPDQAGLSVLKSFGYGVPFITKTDAITGGERLNILNGINGILYQSQEELNNIMSDTEKSIDYFYEMGLNALEYYNENATIIKMKEGFINAIEYSLK